MPAACKRVRMPTLPLIGGKFKSQEDLLNAYKELQRNSVQ